MAGRIVLRADDGSVLPLDPDRWHDEPSPLEERLLAEMGGPVLDVGCGPGRFVLGLARRGIAALGVDPAGGAVELARRRGATVLQRSVFDPLPGLGRWCTVLLADGNIGIGGQPVGLLRRCRDLIESNGSIVVEVEPPGRAWRRHLARLESETERGAWFRWAVVGADDIGQLAASAGLSLQRLERAAPEGRWFARLASSNEHHSSNDIGAVA